MSHANNTSLIGSTLHPYSISKLVQFDILRSKHVFWSSHDMSYSHYPDGVLQILNTAPMRGSQIDPSDTVKCRMCRNTSGVHEILMFQALETDSIALLSSSNIFGPKVPIKKSFLDLIGHKPNRLFHRRFDSHIWVWHLRIHQLEWAGQQGCGWLPTFT